MKRKIQQRSTDESSSNLLKSSFMYSQSPAYQNSTSYLTQWNTTVMTPALATSSSHIGVGHIGVGHIGVGDEFDEIPMQSDLSHTAGEVEV